MRRWVWSGKLPARKLGNQLFVRRADLTRFLAGEAEEKEDPGGAALSEATELNEEIRRRLRGTWDVLEFLDRSRPGGL